MLSRLRPLRRPSTLEVMVAAAQAAPTMMKLVNPWAIWYLSWSPTVRDFMPRPREVMTPMTMAKIRMPSTIRDKPPPHMVCMDSGRALE